MSDNGRFLSRLIWLTLIVIMLIIFMRSSFDFFMPGDHREHAEPRIVEPRGNLAEDEQSTITLFENSRDSVVFITTRQRVMDAWTRNIFSVQAVPALVLFGMITAISSPIFMLSGVPAKQKFA